VKLLEPNEDEICLYKLHKGLIDSGLTDRDIGENMLEARAIDDCTAFLTSLIGLPVDPETDLSQCFKHVVHLAELAHSRFQSVNFVPTVAVVFTLARFRCDICKNEHHCWI
jgi:hypothetical protein